MQSAVSLVAKSLFVDFRYSVWRFELRTYRLLSRSLLKDISTLISCPYDLHPLVLPQDICVADCTWRLGCGFASRRPCCKKDFGINCGNLCLASEDCWGETDLATSCQVAQEERSIFIHCILYNDALPLDFEQLNHPGLTWDLVVKLTLLTSS